MILKEYREGATAPFLASKWRVSEHAIRARITRHGATKRDWGDEQAIGQAAARLFQGSEMIDWEATYDPAMLKLLAMGASARAMTGRLWPEAKALAGLAESYARLEARADEKVSLETAPLWLVAQAAAGGFGKGYPKRLSFTHPSAPRDKNHADNEPRHWYWDRRGEWERARKAELRAEYERGVAAGRAACACFDSGGVRPQG